jgi:putative ABC transport system permease protein
MKYWRIIWKNVTRNKKRTSLTVLSIAFSLLLVTFLRTLVVELGRANPAAESTRRVVVRRLTSLQERMPESYRQKLERMPHIQSVAAMDWFGGIYREPKNFFANFALDHDKIFDMFPEIKVDESVQQAWLSQRSAAICGIKLAERFGWKVGDKITLLGSIYPVDLDFTLVGVYTSVSDEQSFYFHRDYFEEALGKPGMVGVWYLLCDTAENVPTVISTVDATFRNTDAETLTETERAFEAGFTQMIGNVKGLVLSISGVIVFMILLITGNTMAMNIRERSHEIAIMKSLGFQNESLIGILVGESVIIAIMGGLLGVVGGKFLLAAVDLSKISMGFLRSFQVELPTVALGLAIAFVVGLASGVIPAFHVTRLTVSDGLRRIG